MRIQIKYNQLYLKKVNSKISIHKKVIGLYFKDQISL